MLDKPLRAWLLALLLVSPAAGAESPDELLARFETPAPALERAVRVSALELDLGSARLILDEGLVVPAESADESVGEFVFLGRGSVTLASADEIETAQIELFTGEESFEERIEAAVLVVCRDAHAALLLGGAAAQPSEEQSRQAREIFDEWATGPHRKELDVRELQVLDALGDPFVQPFFAGKFRGTTFDSFFLTVDPAETEQLTLGQHKALDATNKEKRKLRRFLHRQQRRGRFLGADPEHLGHWDTWASLALTGEGGESVPASAPFEPTRYTLDVKIDPLHEHVGGTARLALTAMTGGTRVVPLRLNPDLTVFEARDGEGNELVRLQNGKSVYVLLNAPVEAGGPATIELEYGGKLLEKLGGKLFVLRDSTHWYPHAGTIDRATYDVTLRHAKGIEHVASGRPVASGEQDGLVWERRTLDIPAIGFSFEVGDYEIRKLAAGRIQVEVAFNRQTEKALDRIREEVSEAIRGSLTYYDETFGPYPLDYLTVATVPRGFSQGLPGFVTISDLYLANLDEYAVRLGLTDRRLIVAHEIAHQWWGNMVGWKSYRDEWISEAMANFAAGSWARNKLPDDEQPRITLVEDWEDTLTDLTEDGRPLESLGPITLGQRLDSSVSDQAYQAIVYAKGAVVLNTLSAAYGEEMFLKLLHEVVRVATGKVIDTESFVELLERASGADLAWFSRQFLHGTGLPEVYYEYDFRQASNGKWKVTGKATQQTPYRFRYRVDRTADGGFDVARETVSQIDVGDFAMAVPVSIAVHDPSKPDERRKRSKKSTEPRIDGVIDGRLLIRGQSYDFDFEIPYQPVKLYFDRKGEVFGRFFSLDHQPKRVTFYRALDRIAAGDGDGALATLEQALTASMSGADEDPKQQGFLQEKLSQDLQSRIRLQIARIKMDRGELAAAEEQARLIDKETTGALFREPIKERLRLLEGRLSILRRDYEAAYRILTRANKKDITFWSPEGYALLAIAAAQTGNDAMYERVAELAEKKRIDISALEGR